MGHFTMKSDPDPECKVMNTTRDTSHCNAYVFLVMRQSINQLKGILRRRPKATSLTLSSDLVPDCMVNNATNGTFTVHMHAKFTIHQSVEKLCSGHVTMQHLTLNSDLHLYCKIMNGTNDILSYYSEYIFQGS